MADLTIVRGNALPNSSQKADFHNLIDLATGSVSNIVNADIDSVAAIAASKLDLSSIAQSLVMSSKILKQAKGADVASVAGAITLGDDGNYFDITGTNAITSITAKTAGTVVTLQFDSTASLVDGSNLKLAGDFQGAAEAQISLVSDGTNWFEVCRQPSTFTPSASNALAGSIVQIVNTQTGAVGTGSTTTPNDDTIPAITEGNEILSTSYTPLSATNKLIFIASVTVNESTNTGAAVAVALHRATVTDALCVATADATSYAGSSAPEPTVLVHHMTAPGTSTYTFSIRAGCDTGPVTWNGNNGGRKYGGVLISSLTIIEVKA